MSIKSTLCLSVSTMILASAVNAEEINPFFLPKLNAQTVSENNSSYEVAAMQFLPDWAESGGSFTGNSADGDYGGNEIKAKGCPEGYQTGGCTGDTPFTVSTTRAENGNSCYQCRAFQASDCENLGYYTQDHWDALKPQAALNLPKESMFAQLFGNIFGFRNAQAIIGNNDINQPAHFQQNVDKIDGGGGGGGSVGGGTGGTNQSTNEDSKKDNTEVGGGTGTGVGSLTLEACIISPRKVVNKEVENSLYTFNKTGECKYNSSYIKGEWVGGCDETKYKYDSSNCQDILAGNKCGDKWDGCYKCSELYSITNAGTCKWPLPGVYEPNQTRVGFTDIAVGSCSKTTEGCLYNCLIWLEPIEPTEPDCSAYTYTTSNCNGILGGGTCSGKYKTCTSCAAPKTANAARTSCSCPSEYKYTSSNCSGTLNGSSCDGKYRLCAVSSGGGYVSFSDDRWDCGPQGSMC